MTETLPTTVEVEGGSSCIQLYTADLSKRITNLYSQGYSLEKICKQAEMPTFNTLFIWMREHKEFRDAINAVREVRALSFEDKAISTAEDATGKDSDRLKFDAYKWGAEVNDPGRYGKRTVLEGNKDKPLTFIIATGFPEPKGYQKPPRLGEDGLIIREVVAEEIYREEDQADEISHAE